MRIRAAAILAVVMVTGCKYGAAEFACSAEKSCGPGGTCESNGFCSFADSTCESGRRFGELGGASSGECVPAGGAMIDASIDAPPDVPPDVLACYGNGLVRVCFNAPPMTPLPIAAPMTVDTMTSPLCAATVSGGANYCVIVATSISVDATLRATGTKPLVLIASDMITVGATIDVGSHRTVPEFVGAGADPVVGCNAGTAPGAGGGGGAGG
ncbi:MAG TPA: hypothetical protein VK601_03000, partial [Kofleriaceae bacterium]|nr:hypothetical protein [Kofleriaceae bacterium]